MMVCMLEEPTGLVPILNHQVMLGCILIQQAPVESISMLLQMMGFMLKQLVHLPPPIPTSITGQVLKWKELKVMACISEELMMMEYIFRKPEIRGSKYQP